MVVQAEALQMSNATLHIETAMGRQGPWTTALTVGAGSAYTVQSVVLTRESGAGSSALRNLVRWRVEAPTAGAADFESCFRVDCAGK